MFPSIYYPAHVRSPLYWFLRDRTSDTFYLPLEEQRAHKSLLFHISSGDYITTLATILRFFEETIYDEKTTSEMRALQLETIKNMRNDLLYLDKHYTIVPKNKKQ